MNPTDFAEANFRLLPPPSMPERLSLTWHRYPPRTMRPGGLLAPGESPPPATVEPGGYISCWEPTAEERAAIAAGGPVWIYVVGDGAPPPIAVSGLSPFGAPAEPPAPGFAERYAALEPCRPDAKSATYDLAELCVCGHRRGEHGTKDERELAAGLGDGHCCACTCPAFLPAAEGPDPFLEDNPPHATAAEVYWESRRCLWCGETYGEHADAPLPVTPRMPCVGEKAHFVDARLAEKSPE